jgi:hypothetical protein
LNGDCCSLYLKISLIPSNKIMTPATYSYSWFIACIHSVAFNLTSHKLNISWIFISWYRASNLGSKSYRRRVSKIYRWNVLPLKGRCHSNYTSSEVSALHSCIKTFSWQLPLLASPYFVKGWFTMLADDDASSKFLPNRYSWHLHISFNNIRQLQNC